MAYFLPEFLNSNRVSLCKQPFSPKAASLFWSLCKRTLCSSILFAWDRKMRLKKSSSGTVGPFVAAGGGAHLWSSSLDPWKQGERLAPGSAGRGVSTTDDDNRGCFINDFYYVAVVSWYSEFECIEFCQMLFIHQLRWLCVIFFSILFVWCIRSGSTQSCIPGIRLSWSWYIILSICAEFCLLECWWLLPLYSKGHWCPVSFGMRAIHWPQNDS